MTDNNLESAIAIRLANACERWARRPAIEAVDASWMLTYEDLAQRSNELLEWLGIVRGQTLVIFGPKNDVYYAGLTACFLNGLDVCPIDGGAPPARVSEIVDQLESPVVLVSDHAVAERLSALGVSDVRIAGSGKAAARGVPARDLSSPPSYLIATSGSSGVPKIVVVPHDNTIDFIDWAIMFYEIDHTTRWSGFSSIGFDLSLVDFLVVLCGGGTLVPLSTRLERSRLQRTIESARISHWHSVPSVIAYILAEQSSGTTHCRLFTFCGEPLASADVSAILNRFPGARVINTYGPTEATLFCAYHEVNADLDMAEATLPIGTPIPGWNFIFKAGDDGFWRLLIESTNVARYLGADSNQFSSFEAFGGTHRLFDTGDYFARRNGKTYFAHRSDGMVKLAGNRIDLGEIESRCKTIGLKNPVALLVSGRIEIIAEASGIAVDDARGALREVLPNYAVPSSIHTVSEHPRTMSGKIDRGAVAKGHRHE